MTKDNERTGMRICVDFSTVIRSNLCVSGSITMGGVLTTLMGWWFGGQERKICMVGLDNAGEAIPRVT